MRVIYQMFQEEITKQKNEVLLLLVFPSSGSSQSSRSLSLLFFFNRLAIVGERFGNGSLDIGLEVDK